jgi:hypothetical protein
MRPQTQIQCNTSQRMEACVENSVLWGKTGALARLAALGGVCESCTTSCPFQALSEASTSTSAPGRRSCAMAREGAGARRTFRMFICRRGLSGLSRPKCENLGKP